MEDKDERTLALVDAVAVNSTEQKQQGQGELKPHKGIKV
jgi:hypothetical protein